MEQQIQCQSCFIKVEFRANLFTLKRFLYTRLALLGPSKPTTEYKIHLLAKSNRKRATVQLFFYTTAALDFKQLRKGRRRKKQLYIKDVVYRQDRGSRREPNKNNQEFQTSTPPPIDLLNATLSGALVILAPATNG